MTDKIKNDKVYAPFTDEQVKNFNDFQDNERGIHPFTCCSPEGCERPGLLTDRTLIGTNTGLICRCGKYIQDWCYPGPLEPIPPFDMNTFKDQLIRNVEMIDMMYTAINGDED